MFDLGNVLFPFDFKRVINYLQQFNPQINLDSLNQMKDLLLNYELGKISSNMFFESVRNETLYPGTFDEFRLLFSNIFEENREVISIALKLKKKYPVFILSNTNEMHLEYLKNTFKMFRVINEGVYSYEVGFAKPDPRIFLIAIERFHLEPASTIFIDDRLENIQTALSLGFQTIHYSLSNEKSKFPLEETLTKYNIVV